MLEIEQGTLAQHIDRGKNQKPGNGMDSTLLSSADNPSDPLEHGVNETARTEKAWPRHVALAARLILGAVFIYASLDKILNPAAFAETVFNYQLLPAHLINLMALILPWLELFLGVLLLSGIWLPGAVFGANLLMITFLSALIYNTARGLNISCGCFPAEATASVLSWRDVLRDVFFLGISSYLLFVIIRMDRPEKRSEGIQTRD